MEAPEWVRIAGHGTAEELRVFILANPGFNWDAAMFNGRLPFSFITLQNPFPLTMLDILYSLGGAKFDKPDESGKTPTRLAIVHGMEDWLLPWLLSHNVPVPHPACLTLERCEIQEMILEHSTYLTKETATDAIRLLDGQKRRGMRDPQSVSEWTLRMARLRAWVFSHDSRTAGTISVAWTLSQLTGTSWPDMCEQLATMLMSTRVREW
jgi:hypothetical protein